MAFEYSRIKGGGLFPLLAFLWAGRKTPDFRSSGLPAETGISAERSILNQQQG
jgi:hypothetical protein